MERLLLRRKASDLIEKSPLIYTRLLAYRLRSKPAKRKVITKEHQIVIEGFPRCANSFSVAAFRKNNDPDRTMKVATHLHSPAPILLGLKWNIPVLVLIREPDAAVPSLLGLAAQLEKHPNFCLTKKSTFQYVNYWTRRYAAFYSRLMSVRSKFVIGEFDSVTKDFDPIISELNQKYNKQYRPFDHTPEAVEEIFSAAQVHLSPSPERDRLKKRFREVYLSKENEPARLHAGRVYREFLNPGA